MHTYPRSHDRGPIEALRGLVPRLRAVCYPRSHDRGPIEAGDERKSHAKASASYPRSHDRGPIEANLLPVDGLAVDPAIRGHMTAAPLKP